MKRLLCALVAFVPLAASSLTPIKADVYRWKNTKAEQRDGRTERLIVSGSTLDLDSLEIRAISLSVGGADSTDAHPNVELFLMVKDGALRIAQAGTTKVLGAGSVAVALPGDQQVIANVGATAATYYRFAYRSKAPMDLARGKQAGGSFMVDWSDLTERPTASGTRRDVLNRPTAMWRRFEAHVSSVSEGLRNHATHTHRADEIMMLTKGDVEMLIGEARPTATASDVVFLGSMIPHSLGNIGKGTAQYLVIQGE
jgi:(S)-ureidoglycine aminohydrolase